MKSDFLKKSKICVPYALLVLIIVLPWFLKSGYLFFTDMHWGPKIVVPDFTSSGHFYLHFLVKILSFVLPSEWLQKLFITSVFGLILFGGYKLAQSLAQNNLVLFLGSAFTLFNPLVYDRLMYGQFGLLLSYGFFLVMLGYLIRYFFEPGNKKQLFLGSVFNGLSILFTPSFIFFISLVYSVFGILIFLKLFSKKKKGGLPLHQKFLGEGLLKVSKYFLLSILIVLAINFNWLHGAFFGGPNAYISRATETKITQQDLQVFKTRGRDSFEVLENVLMMSGFWGMEQFRYQSLRNIKENWGKGFYFLLPIIIWGLAADFRNKEKRKLKIGLLIIYSIAFILAVGVALPVTSKITLWLFNNIPFYKGLRETQKWVVVMVVVYEIVLVSGLIELFKKKIIIKNKELLTAFLTLIIFLQAPLMVWGGAGQVKSIDYPKDWYEIDNFIVKETNCEKKILFLPWHLYMSFKWIGNIVANPSSKFFQCEGIYGKNIESGGIYSQSLDPADREVEKWLFSFGRTHLLEENKLNIGYIVLAKEVDWQNYLWIGNHPNVEFIKETENLRLYRVVKYEEK